jgi:glycosyltransferase involved in cell wall biosynthesis
VTIRIGFVINSLATGGAQMMLYKLLSGMDRQRFAPEVLTLSGTTPVRRSLEARFEKIDVPVHVFDMEGGFSRLVAFAQMTRYMRGHFDLVQTWMYHADLIGGLAASLAGGIPVIWNIRHSDLRAGVDKRGTLAVARMCARLSRFLPKAIVCCAHQALNAHAAMGYDRDRMKVIPNGFDLEIFRKDVQSRREGRQTLGVDAKTPVIGLVGRYHRQKGHLEFLKAASLISKSYPHAVFVLCGDGVTWENRELSDLVDAYGLRPSVRLLGRYDDMPGLLPSFDIATSASICGEGFSNTVGEAMACGVPCVVTDVGDSALVVADTGVVVPPQNAEALAQGWASLLSLESDDRDIWSQRARVRIEEHFSLPAIIDQYQDLFCEVLAQYRPSALSRG